MYQKLSFLLISLIIRIFIDFIRFCFPFFCIHWLMDHNFKMKRFVIFELKTHKLTHQDIGQLDMYVRMYDDLVKGADDAPTVGVLLCTDTDSTIARYSVLHDNDQLYATKYMTYMPTEEELRNEIEQQKRFFLEQHGEE